MIFVVVFTVVCWRPWRTSTNDVWRTLTRTSSALWSTTSERTQRMFARNEEAAGRLLRNEISLPLVNASIRARLVLRSVPGLARPTWFRFRMRHSNKDCLCFAGKQSNPIIKKLIKSFPVNTLQSANVSSAHWAMSPAVLARRIFNTWKRWLKILALAHWT